MEHQRRKGKAEGSRTPQGLKRQIQRNTAEKFISIREYAHKFYLCLSSEFSIFKLADPIRRKIIVLWLRKGEVRLAPYENDNAKGRKFNKYRA